MFPHVVMVSFEIENTLKAFDHFRNKQKIV